MQHYKTPAEKLVLFKRNLVHLRTQKGWTQEEVAKKIGKPDRRYIGTLEVARFVPKVKTIEKVLALFAVTYEDITEHDLTKGIPARPSKNDPAEIARLTKELNEKNATIEQLTIKIREQEQELLNLYRQQHKGNP